VRSAARWDITADVGEAVVEHDPVQPRMLRQPLVLGSVRRELDPKPLQRHDLTLPPAADIATTAASARRLAEPRPDRRT
jgi:hypothetical protein